MFATDQATAASTLPTPAAAGTQGYFTNGNPSTGVAATIVDADWLNMLQMELLNIVTAAGITPSKTTYTQVRDAIKAMILGGAGVAPLVGQFSNLKASAASGATSVAFTAESIIVGAAVGGATYRITGFSQTFTPSTVGAGGMDTGSATASKFVAVYAGYNPTSGAQTIFGTLEGSSAAPSVYGGSNAPAGYTATCLLAVVPISATVNQFALFRVVNRATVVALALFLNGTTSATALPAYSSFTTGGIPISAKVMTGSISVSNSVASNSHFFFGTDTSGAGAVDFSYNSSAAGGTSTLFRVQLPTPQVIGYAAYGSSSSNVLTYGLTVNGWEI